MRTEGLLRRPRCQPQCLSRLLNRQSHLSGGLALERICNRCPKALACIRAFSLWQLAQDTAEPSLCLHSPAAAGVHDKGDQANMGVPLALRLLAALERWTVRDAASGHRDHVHHADVQAHPAAGATVVGDVQDRCPRRVIPSWYHLFSEGVITLPPQPLSDRVANCVVAAHEASPARALERVCAVPINALATAVPHVGLLTCAWEASILATARRG